MNVLTIQSSKHKEILDSTDVVHEQIQKSRFSSGSCHLFVAHTTADLDPYPPLVISRLPRETASSARDPCASCHHRRLWQAGTALDMLDTFQAMMPKCNYRHPHNPQHVPDHILSSLIGTSLLLAVRSKKLLIGTWQRVVIVELDRPRERTIYPSYLRHQQAP